MHQLEVEGAGTSLVDADGRPIALIASPSRELRPARGSAVADVMGFLLLSLGGSGVITGGAMLAVPEGEVRDAAGLTLGISAGVTVAGILLAKLLGHYPAEYSQPALSEVPQAGLRDLSARR